MAFWNNVLLELDYLGMTNKTLAEKCGFDASNIGRGIRLGSSPSVETAVKIAKVLNVSVEYLANGNDYSPQDATSVEDLRLFHKYYGTIKQLDALTDKEKKSIIHLIEELNK